MIRKILTVLLCSIMVITTASCGANAPAESAASGSSDAAAPAPTQSDEKVLVGISTSNGSSSYQVRMLASTTAEIEKRGGEYILVDAALDPAKQISDVEDLLQRNIDVLIIEAVDSSAFLPAIELTKAKGVPVIVQNVFPTDEILEKVNGITYPDVYQAGYELGKEIFTQMGGEGQVFAYHYSLVEVTIIQGQGFLDAAKEFPNIDIVKDEDGDPASEAAMRVAESWLQQYPEVGGVYTFNDSSSYGFAAAIEAADRTGKTLLGFPGGGEKEDWENLRDGVLAAFAVGPTTQLGVIAVDLAYKAIEAGVDTFVGEEKAPYVVVTAKDAEEGLKQFS